MDAQTETETAPARCGACTDYRPGDLHRDDNGVWVCSLCSRAALLEEAERLIGYWGIHGDDPAVVSAWAVKDLLELARLVLEQDS